MYEGKLEIKYTIAKRILEDDNRAEGTRPVNSYRAAEFSEDSESEYDSDSSCGSENQQIKPFQLNQYKIEKILGKGSYGTVYLGHDILSGTQYAIKKMTKAILRKQDQACLLKQRQEKRLHDTESAPPRFKAAGMKNMNFSELKHVLEEQKENEKKDEFYLIRNELAVMKRLDHENVIRLHEVINDPIHDKLYMDIKPDNLLLNKYRVLKISDFGESRIIDELSNKKQSPGTPAFSAPELLGESDARVDPYSSDVWALGVTLYCITQGQLPFPGNSIIEISDSIKNDLQFSVSASDELKDLITSMLKINIDERISLDQMRVGAQNTLV
ncbi:Serine/threonine-protein kinase ppk34 [Zancudomyces culisetae]|uniref:Serine/threonine-protein kinase ppk34 n=1 Tax=Zancudomyces culisetae TaxID=1213189 RepID=A0A1R1PSJ7_ZANCU|nr:Serine/threonine-protein kinase ppk34 [Zancudomyces culisetae]|eukprot:OMH83966.1 Serine/threonine-protein kinase ppk34 [Zancudomyces culisetae]